MNIILGFDETDGLNLIAPSFWLQILI
jgi:hypothetical protein